MVVCVISISIDSGCMEDINANEINKGKRVKILQGRGKFVEDE